uniref:RNA-directed DNA polymerase n=1 Tax=Plectus sambesii TaxID=2011161 RepID=A0A914UPP6_9BILA
MEAGTSVPKQELPAAATPAPFSSYQVTPPPKYNIGDSWKTWSLLFKVYLEERNTLSDKGKKVALLSSLSIKAVEELQAICEPDDPLDDDVKFEDLLSGLSRRFLELTNDTLERNKFFQLKMGSSSLREFASSLKKAAATCKFPPAYYDMALTDGFILGVPDYIRSVLIRDKPATLAAALESAENVQLSKSSLDARPQSSADFQSVNQIQKSKSSAGDHSCYRCGKTNHLPDNCRFRNERCNACNKQGHIAKVCRSKSQQSSESQKGGEGKKGFNSSKNNQVVANLDDIKVSTLTSHADLVDTQRIGVQLQMNGVPAELEYDTGAAVTVINKNLWSKLGKPPLSNSRVNCRGYNNQKIPLLGEATVDVACDGKQAKLKMLVSHDGDNVMGRSWIHALQLFCECRLKTCMTPLKVSAVSCSTSASGTSTIDELLSEFPQVFQPGLGHCTKTKAHLSLKQDSRPKFLKARPLPYAVYDAVDKELDRLVEQGVLQPINYSDWAAPVVIAPKPGGQIRLCADFSTGLNASLDLHQYPLPKPEELFSKLNGGQVFSKIDFSEAYLQMELEEESKKLVVINTHKGLFQYNRLPFGVSSAPAIFQQTMEKMLTGVPGVGVYLDDIIVTGTTEAAHLQNLRQVLRRITDYGFRLKKEKCSWAQSSVEYLGFIVDGRGQHTSSKKTKAIVDMPAPKNVHQLRSFLGMVQHYARFVPALSTRLSPLHQLLRKQEGSINKLVPYDWTAECHRAFEEIKKDLISPRMLVHYTPHLPIVMAADASNDGIGAVIAHRMPDGQELPIAHASKTLSDAEKRYPQIQKEALALIFGIKKFHKYLWGRHFVLQTDHQPLVKIFGSKKGLPATAANRLQNYAIILMAYSFDIEYVKTDAFGQADGLSRLPAGDDVDF